MAKKLGNGAVVVANPFNSDILCGRGYASFYHEGNINFRITIASHMTEYLAAQTKGEKTRLVRRIVDDI